MNFSALCRVEAEKLVDDYDDEQERTIRQGYGAALRE
jgi:hypothetical protein